MTPFGDLKEKEDVSFNALLPTGAWECVLVEA